MRIVKAPKGGIVVRMSLEEAKTLAASLDDVAIFGPRETFRSDLEAAIKDAEK